MVIMTAQPYKIPKYRSIVHLTVDELYGMQATSIFLIKKINI